MEEFYEINIGRRLNQRQKRTSVTNALHILTFTEMENQL